MAKTNGIVYLFESNQHNNNNNTYFCGSPVNARLKMDYFTNSRFIRGYKKKNSWSKCILSAYFYLNSFLLINGCVFVCFFQYDQLMEQFKEYHKELDRLKTSGFSTGEIKKVRLTRTLTWLDEMKWNRWNGIDWKWVDGTEWNKFDGVN